MSRATNKSTSARVQAVDLFCGIGGLTHGLHLGGIAVKAGVDNDPTCRYAFETNNEGAKFICKDVRRRSETASATSPRLRPVASAPTTWRTRQCLCQRPIGNELPNQSPAALGRTGTSSAHRIRETWSDNTELRSVLGLPRSARIRTESRPAIRCADSPAGQRAAPAALSTTPSTRQVALAMPLAEAPWAVDEEEPHPTAFR